MHDSRNKATAELVRHLLAYDPETGIVTRLVARGGEKVGDIVGSPMKGYLNVCIDRVKYQLHRVIFLWMTGEWPKEHIDHWDGGNKANNKWTNLREATRFLNLQNQRRPQANNKTGFLGVSRYRNKFAAEIEANGKRTRLGKFDTPEQAHLAYIAAKRAMHEGCTI